MGFEIIGDALSNPTVRSYIYTVIGVLFALIVLIIVRYVMRGVAKRQVGSIKDTPAMSMMDIEQMRKKGLISEQECRAIRHSLAGSELDKERRRQQAEREKVLLAQVEHDPDAARLLLENPPEPPGARASSPATPAPQSPRQPAQPGTRAPSPAASAPSSQPAPDKPPRPVSQPAAASPKSAPAAKAPASATPSANRAGDLDILLEKGAITPEEYQRLKSFFQ